MTRIGKSFLAVTTFVLLSGCAARQPLPLPRIPLSLTPMETFRGELPLDDGPETFELPEVEQWQLKNGLRVVFMRRPGALVGAVSLVSGTAGEDGPSKRAGWSTLVGQLLPRAQVTRDHGRMSARVTTREIPGAIVSLARIIRQFEPAPLEVENACETLRRNASTSSWSAMLQGRRALWGEGHRVAVPLVGTEESLETVIPQRLQVHFLETWHPERSVLAVVGDIGSDRLRQLVQEQFGSWSSGDRRAAELSGPVTRAEPTEERVIGIDTRSNLATVTLLESAPPVGHEDWPLFYVVTHLLGRMRSSRLFATLRRTGGLTYGVHGAYFARRTHGELRISTNVSIWHVEEALRLYHSELRRLTTEGPQPDELERARALARERLFPPLDSSEAVAESLAVFALSGLDAPAIEEHVRRMDQATPDDIRAAAQRWLRPDHAPILIVGEMGAVSTGINRSEVGRVRYVR